MKAAHGNILGAPEAELDQLLERAFIETGDYRALTQSTDYNFVVGRRGTGKSALFRKTGQYFSQDNSVFVRTELPLEHTVLSLQHSLSLFTSEYQRARSALRVIWKLHLLWTAVELLEKHYKISRSGAHQFLSSYISQYPQIFGDSTIGRCVVAVQAVKTPGLDILQLPGLIATHFQLEKLQQAVNQAFRDVRRTLVVLLDRLDEGWLPYPIPTAVLGGLCLAISDLEVAEIGIHCVAFIRDNIFRALAHFDSDFSRHIEGHSIRLKWSSESLLTFVAKRLRIALSLNIESDIRIWNRFAHRHLQDRQGFEATLRHTLFRPRDILVLLNLAFATARNANRGEIVDSDVGEASRAVSRDRLDDLIKEYDSVLPGLGLFVRVFQDGPAVMKMADVVSCLSDGIAASQYGQRGAGDFALFETPGEAATALHSVGFLGIQSDQKGHYRFSHDGSSSTIDPFRHDTETMIHPCYWAALNLQADSSLEEVTARIDDDLYQKGAELAVRDLRIRLLGQLVENYPTLPLGVDGAKEFEDWAFRTLKILFGESLSNFQLKPNPAAIQQRDIVATNMASSGFWKRILDDYGSRQSIFEIKNKDKLDEDDFRQVLSYMGRDYGNFAVVIYRSNDEGLTASERGWVREIYTHQDRLIFLLPGIVLSRCVSKLRTADKYNYTDQQLGKRMDTFVRSYLSLKHERSYRARKRKRASAAN